MIKDDRDEKRMKLEKAKANIEDNIRVLNAQSKEDMRNQGKRHKTDTNEMMAGINTLRIEEEEEDEDEEEEEEDSDSDF